MSGTKFLPHIEQLEAVAKKLPDAQLWPEETYAAVLDVRKRRFELTFRRVRYLNREGKPSFRWAYEGLVRVT